MLHVSLASSYLWLKLLGRNSAGCVCAMLWIQGGLGRGHCPFGSGPSRSMGGHPVSCMKLEYRASWLWKASLEKAWVKLQPR